MLLATLAVLLHKFYCIQISNAQHSCKIMKKIKGLQVQLDICYIYFCFNSLYIFPEWDVSMQHFCEILEMMFNVHQILFGKFVPGWVCFETEPLEELPPTKLIKMTASSLFLPVSQWFTSSCQYKDILLIYLFYRCDIHADMFYSVLCIHILIKHCVCSSVLGYKTLKDKLGLYFFILKLIFVHTTSVTLLRYVGRHALLDAPWQKWSRLARTRSESSSSSMCDGLDQHSYTFVVYDNHTRQSSFIILLLLLLLFKAWHQ